VLEEVPQLGYLQVLRLSITLKRMEFRKQFQVIEKLFKHVPIMKMRVDSTGMGKNIAEDLGAAFHSRIEDVTFTNENKGDMASNLKLRMEDQSIAYPSDKDLMRQIHSIKRKTTDTSVVKFEVDQSERKAHHGDKFWALALASAAGQPAQMHRVTLLSKNITRKIANTDRIIQMPQERTFIKTNLIQGINYKKLPQPVKHVAEFNIGGMINL
jgi:phage FluMu gp28-like protein